MNNTKLIAALFLTGATVLSLPSTAAADGFSHERGRGEAHAPAPYGDRYYHVHHGRERHQEMRYHHDHRRQEPSRRHHGHVHDYERRQQHQPSIVYGPVLRWEYLPSTPRPLERTQYRGNDDLRMRIVYDLKL